METTTNGSELVVTKQCAEQVRELKETLKLIRIPIEESAWMLGNNSSVITSSTIPSFMLKKCHQALSYHYVCTCIAYGFLKFCFLKSEKNGADTCTKFLPFVNFWPLIQPLLFWKGNTLSGVNKLFLQESDNFY